jgi:acyl carrier protein
MTENPSRASIDGAEIAGKIRTILSSLLEIDESDIQPTTRLEDLGADSLLYLELFEELKDEFKLDVDLHQLGKYSTRYPLSTVGELTDLVVRYAEKGDAIFTELEQSPRGPAAER